MTNFAYLRVSTDRQDAKNQKLGILDYCNSKSINNLKIVVLCLGFEGWGKILNLNDNK